MSKPTSVTVLDDNRLYVEVLPTESPKRFLNLGFVKAEPYESLYFYKRSVPNDIYAMCEKMRDMGIPFSTHHHGGADYMLATLRDEGHVSGKFMRINYFDNDFDDDAPYELEEF